MDSLKADAIFFNAQKAIWLLAILYLVGIVGAVLPIHPEFLRLTPINLLLSIGLLLYFSPMSLKENWVWLLVIYFIGWSVECLGVQTGFPFGDYQYGIILGPKIWETPLMIGVNWVLVGLCVAAFIQYFEPKFSKPLKITLAAALMVLTDVIIEPVAISTGMWTWESGTPPIQNYIGWFVVGWLVQWIIFSKGLAIFNKVGFALLLFQWIFFISLYLLL